MICAVTICLLSFSGLANAQTDVPTLAPTAAPYATPPPSPIAHPTGAVHEIEWSTESVNITLDVYPGDTVTWIWADDRPHSVTSPPMFGYNETQQLVDRNASDTGDLFDAPVDFPGATFSESFASAPFNFSFVFTRIGSFEFDCRLHSTMRGVINVVPSGVEHNVMWKVEDGSTNATIDVQLGDTVTWIWNDTAQHSVTSPPWASEPPEERGMLFNDPPSNGQFDGLVSSPYRFSFVFRASGTFHVDCRFHASMVTTVTVPAPSPTNAPSPFPTISPTPSPTPSRTVVAADADADASTNSAEYLGLGLYGFIGLVAGAGAFVIIVVVVLCVWRRRRIARFNRIYWEHAPSGKNKRPSMVSPPNDRGSFHGEL